MPKQTDNIPMTARNMETQDKPPKPNRKIPCYSDWSDSEDGKDDQARAPHTNIDIQDPQPNTSFASYASEATPLQRLNTCPKVLSLGRDRGIAPLANWTSVPKGCGHGLNTYQTLTEPETNVAVVPPSDKNIYTDRVQTYDEIPAAVRPKHPLANWTSVSLGDDPNRPTVHETSDG